MRTFQRLALDKANREQSKTIPPDGGCFTLFLLFVNGVLLSYRVELFSLVLLTWVLFYFIIKPSVVNVAFTNAIGVALGYQLYE